MTPTELLQQRPTGARHRVAGAMLVAVLLAHAALLVPGAREFARQRSHAGAGPPAPAAKAFVSVRSLPAAAAPDPDGRAAGSPTARAAAPVPPSAARADAGLQPKALRGGRLPVPVVATEAVARTTPTPTPTPPSTSTSTPIAAEVLPRYRTRLPPATTLRYAVQRGGLADETSLIWQPDSARYRIELLGYASEGGYDTDGVAPERHTESHRGRERRAVNFQREHGRISFSGSQGTAALAPGAQDRLSWMIQLAAVLAGEPALRDPGSEVAMVVAGVRGEATVWRFQVLAVEALELPVGSVQTALHLRHEPTLPYALQVDVWLDPARHFLPVQLSMRRPGAAVSAPGGMELRLVSIQP